VKEARNPFQSPPQKTKPEEDFSFAFEVRFDLDVGSLMTISSPY